MFRIAKRTRRDDTRLLADCRKAASRTKLSPATLALAAQIPTDEADALLSPAGKPRVVTLTAAAAHFGLDLKKYVEASDKYYVHFRDHLGLEQRVPGTTDKRTTEEYARHLETLVNARKAGAVPVAATLKWAESLPPEEANRLVALGLVEESVLTAGLPINDHLAAWAASLTTNKRTAKHVAEAERLARVVLEAAGVQQWAMVTPGRIEAALGKIQMKGGRSLSPQTRNKHVAAAKAFARFMKRSGRTHTNPLEDMGKVQTTKRGRRAASREEMEWLIATTRKGPTMTSPDWGCKWEASGPERALIYMLVCCTGLRAKEARGLKVKDFRLDAETPHIVVSAGLAKNRTANMVPLSPELAATLRDFLGKKLPEAQALAVPKKAAWMLRLDMQAARAAYIEAGKSPAEREARARSPFLEVDRDTDRYLSFDFHSLRGTASVLMQQAGVPVGFVQKILNHKTPIMTLGNYTNPDLGTLAAKLMTMPMAECVHSKAG
jgi:integrase